MGWAGLLDAQIYMVFLPEASFVSNFVSKGERRRRLVRQGEPGRGCACKRVAKSRHIESERIEDLLRCDPARGN